MVGVAAWGAGFGVGAASVFAGFAGEDWCGTVFFDFGHRFIAARQTG